MSKNVSSFLYGALNSLIKYTNAFNFNDKCEDKYANDKMEIISPFCFWVRYVSKKTNKNLCMIKWSVWIIFIYRLTLKICMTIFYLFDKLAKCWMDCNRQFVLSCFHMEKIFKIIRIIYYRCSKSNCFVSEMLRLGVVKKCR